MENIKIIALEDLPKNQLGEGPWWDERGRKLIYVDIDAGTIHRFDPKTGKHESLNAGTSVGFAVLDRDGKVIAGLKDGIYRLAFGTAEKELLAAPRVLPENTRFNDGICDRKGRLWAGTISLDPARPATSSLYCLDETGIQEVVTGVRNSNGLGWSPDNKKMYYADTPTQIVREYDYTIETGKLSLDYRPFAVIPKDDGRPDGLTVDSKGRVLVAIWSGSRINVYKSDGVLEDVIRFPVPNVSSLAFGGDDLKTLFVTSAASKDAPLSGCVFMTEMPIPGIPEARFYSKGCSNLKR
jgi:sugar lactone lactonase YvrE